MTDKKDDTALSNICRIPLEEQVNFRKNKEQLTAVSVLCPTIYIERGYGKNPDSDVPDYFFVDPSEPHAKKTEYYRMVASFTLEIEIVGFDRDTKYNRFFDSISLWYLYHRGEHFSTVPDHSDDTISADVSSEMTKSTSGTFGLQGSTTGVVPSLELHLQKDFKVMTSRKMNSWRLGVSREKCESFASLWLWLECWRRAFRSRHRTTQVEAQGTAGQLQVRRTIYSLRSRSRLFQLCSLGMAGGKKGEYMGTRSLRKCLLSHNRGAKHCNTTDNVQGRFA